MTLKFGLLVILLAVNGVFSEERVPTVPTVDLLSALQVPRLRRAASRTHHAPVQGLHSSTFRRSLFSTETACVWDADSKECSVSLSSVRSLLEGSDTEFAELLLDRLTCVEKTKKKDCNNEKACSWDEELDECYYGDSRRGHGDSPCAKAAPLYFDLDEAWTICQKLDSSTRCEGEKQCVWSSEDALCEADFYFIYFGIKNFAGKVKQVIDSGSWRIVLEYEALLYYTSFTWQSYFDYKPSSIECPSDTDPLVCKYVDVVFPKKAGSTVILLDALCKWDKKSNECTVVRSVLRSARFAALTVLTDSMPDGQDKRILEADYACESIFKEESCSGACTWYPAFDECMVRDDYTADLLTKAGKNTTDALCTFLAVDGFAECLKQLTKKKCQKTELCFWDGEAKCEPTEEFYVSAAADRDPKIKKGYQIVKNKCSTYSTEKTCVEPNKVY